MSRTYKDCRNWGWSCNCYSDFAAWAAAKVEDRYQPTNREKSRSRLLRSYDDKFPSALSDNWNTKR